MAGSPALFKTNDYASFNIPCGLFVLLTAYFGFRNSTDTFMFGNFSSPLLTIGIQVPLFTLMAILARSKRKREKPSDAGASNGSSGVQMKLGLTRRLVRKHPVSRLRWVTRALLMLCACSIVVGLTYSRNISMVGTVCGVAYAVFLLLTLFAGYLDMQRTL